MYLTTFSLLLHMISPSKFWIILIVTMQSEFFQYGEQERYLPLANISRIMRDISPSKYKVSREAKESMQESLSEFIAFVTSEACDKCMHDKRKTISGEDILFAFCNLGFDCYYSFSKLYFNLIKLSFVS